MKIVLNIVCFAVAMICTALFLTALLLIEAFDLFTRPRPRP